MASESGADLREGISTVTRGTILVTVGTLCLVLFNFLSRVVLVRSISDTAWDTFSLGLALAGVLSAIGSLGLPSAVARSLPYATSDAERRTIVRSSVALVVVSAILLTALLWVLAPELARWLHDPSIRIGLEFFSVAIAASIVSSLLASIFQGYADVTPNAIFLQIVNPALFLAFLGAAFFLPGGRLTYTGALAAYAAANVVTLGTVAAYGLRRLPGRLPPGPLAPEATGRLVRFAAPLLIAGGMSSLAGFGDTIVLGFYHNAEVGTYTASLTLARLLLIGINAASYIFLPVATRFLRRENPRAVGLTYVTVTKWMALLSMPLFFLFFLLPSRSLEFVYGPRYMEVVVPLQIVVAGAFASTLLGPSATTQIAYGRGRLLAYNATVAGLADVGLALALVPRYGYVGAAIAWSTASFLYAGLSLLELAVLERIHPFQRHFLLPLAVSVVPLALLLLPFRAEIPVWALIPLGLAVALAFVLAVLATGSVDEGDGLLLGSVERLLGRPLPFLRWFGRVSRRAFGRS